MKAIVILFGIIALAHAAVAADKVTPADRWQLLVKVIREKGIEAAEKQFRDKVIAFEGASGYWGTQKSSDSILTFPSPDQSVGCRVRLKQNVPPHSWLSIEGRIRSIKPSEELGKTISPLVTVDAIRVTLQPKN